MGQIHISIRGSFENKSEQSFSALTGGHADAIAQAIEWLAALLPKAIAQDHRLHEEGATPDYGFGLRQPPENTRPSRFIRGRETGNSPALKTPRQE